MNIDTKLRFNGPCDFGEGRNVKSLNNDGSKMLTAHLTLWVRGA